MYVYIYICVVYLCIYLFCLSLILSIHSIISYMCIYICVYIYVYTCVQHVYVLMLDHLKPLGREHLSQTETANELFSFSIYGGFLK